MIDDKCKKCRRAGEKLFLKGERCFTPKCAMVRKAYPPGVSAKGGRRPKRLSEYGIQLRAKQKMKLSYGLREKQFAGYARKAIMQKTNSGQGLVELLESRLDNVVFRLGLVSSRSIARQAASHGHFMVNGRKSTIPSRQLKVGDEIKIRPASESAGIFKDMDIRLKKYTPPKWLDLDKGKKIGKISLKPTMEDIMDAGFNINAIIEFYSR